MRKTQSLDASYFDRLYSAHSDPWGFETSAYEREKYDHTLAVVGEEPVSRAFEMGCSIGVLTQKLAARCERLVVTELSQHALTQARRRCAQNTNIDFILVEKMTDGIDGVFDLMLLSEVIYFWDDRDLNSVALAIKDHLRVGGRLVMIHWLGETDYPRSADEAVTAIYRLIGDLFEVCLEDRTDAYRMDVWRRRPNAHPTANKSCD
jgi:predicted TPR repeat methyltransferase